MTLYGANSLLIFKTVIAPELCIWCLGNVLEPLVCGKFFKPKAYVPSVLGTVMVLNTFLFMLFTELFFG